MGRKPHQPTDESREKVREWSRNGVSQVRIAAALGISDDTLRKYYEEDIGSGIARWAAEFEEILGKDIRKEDCPPALKIFLSKVRLGYREHAEVTLHTTDAKELTREQLLAVAQSGTASGEDSEEG